MNKKAMLVEQIQKMLQPKSQDDQFVEYNGRFYRWDDIDIPEWLPKPGAKGVLRNVRDSEIFVISGVKIHF